MELVTAILQVLLCGGFVMMWKRLSSYSEEKGKNLATKEDIGEITKKIEDVKNLFAREQEKHKADLSLRNALQTAAIDKRLEAIQGAYSLVWDLMEHISDRREEFLPRHQEALRWVTHNCIYLEPATEKDLTNGLRSVAEASVLIREHGGPGLSDRIDYSSRIEQIFSSLDGIREAVQLGPLDPARATEFAAHLRGLT